MKNIAMMAFAGVLIGCGGGGSDSKDPTSPTIPKAPTRGITSAGSYISVDHESYYALPAGAKATKSVLAGQWLRFIGNSSVANIKSNEWVHTKPDGTIVNGADERRFIVTFTEVGNHSLSYCATHENQGNTSRYPRCVDMQIQVNDAAPKFTYNVNEDATLNINASEFFNGDAATIEMVGHTFKGGLFVAGNRESLAYDPGGSYQYLNAGESGSITVPIRAKSATESWHGNIQITIDGVANANECTDANSRTISPVTVGSDPVEVNDGQCIKIDSNETSALSGTWAPYEGVNGGALVSFFEQIGANPAAKVLYFKMPATGQLHLNWCPTGNGPCAPKRWQLKNTKTETAKEPTLENWVSTSTHNINDNIVITATPSAHVANPTYRWFVFDQHNGHQKIMDVITKSNQFTLGKVGTAKNYRVDVMVDNNIYEFASGFDSSVHGRVVPVGKHKFYNSWSYIRGDEPNPPKAIVKVNGVRYEPKDMARSLIIVDIEGTNSVKLDATDSIFNANDPMLEFQYWDYENGRRELVSSSTTYNFEFGSDKSRHVDFCIRGEFPWNQFENPCLEFFIMKK
ncbi:hypothetical protein TUMSATVNIG1_49090 [Vibrio nigripulchritudo]|uniref:hypothetical protein n=1 Tax=Vibrio nigripulchritudo TaxID=28173 RepID=UPI00190D0D31|nr:hypothetical protein [Vibrio nigripulchritudo]BCL72936.1 hypothetical protein VNTUMSATTG_48730 [Vibrio nigripulchritudo]BDU34300.1 hypothetical protein TUMSATVNIG1_49090 [Vibrio nigripulchritudo]